MKALLLPLLFLLIAVAIISDTIRLAIDQYEYNKESQAKVEQLRNEYEARFRANAQARARGDLK